MGTTTPDGTVMRIVSWDATYENSRSRQVDRCRWVLLPNRFDGEKISWLIGEGGTSAYGIWCAVLALGSRGTPRGYLMTSGGTPHTASSLARITHLPEKDFDKYLPLCQECRLIEQVGVDEVPGKRRRGVTPTSGERQVAVRPPQSLADPNELEGTKEGKNDEKQPAGANGEVRTRGGLRYAALADRIVEARHKPESRGDDLAFLMRLWGSDIWPSTSSNEQGEHELGRFAELAEVAIQKGRDPIRYIQSVMTKRGKG